MPDTIYRLRKGWFGKSILQKRVEYISSVDSYCGETYGRWEDVRYDDAPVISKGLIRQAKKQPQREE